MKRLAFIFIVLSMIFPQLGLCHDVSSESYLDDNGNVRYIRGLKVNLQATTAPTATDDLSEGYRVGSIWVDVTNDKQYICVDHTEDAAVWEGPSAVTNPVLSGIVYGSEDADGELSLSSTTNATKGHVHIGGSDDTTDLEIGDYGFEHGGVNVGGTTYGSKLRIHAYATDAPAEVVIHRHSTTWPSLLLGVRANNNTTGHTAVTNNMDLLRIYGAGWTGSEYNLSSGIIFDMETTGTISDSSSPGRMLFQVTANGATVPTTAVTINSDKSVDFADRLTIQDTDWDDMRILPGAFDFAGSADPTLSDWQPGGSGATFKVYKFQKDNEVFASTQMSHAYKEGTDLELHIHWTPADRGNEESGAAVGWKVDYTIANVNGTFGSSSTADFSDTVTGTDDKHEITSAVVIDGTGLTISHMILMRIYRSDTGADDTWAGSTAAQSPAILEVDVHYEINTFGSSAQFTK